MNNTPDNTIESSTEASSDNTQLSRSESKWSSLPIFIQRVLNASFSLLTFGLAFIVLMKLNTILTVLNPEPLAFVAGAMVLAAFALMGIPILPAAVAAIAATVLTQYLIP